MRDVASQRFGNGVIDTGHAPFPQGVLGIKVKVMLEWDPSGKIGPKTPLPDVVTVLTPKEEELVTDKPSIGKELDM